MRSARSLGAALFCGVMVACGGGIGGPVAVPTEDLPFELSRSIEDASTDADTVRKSVAFVRRGRIVTIQRRIPIDQPPAEGLIRTLLEGPTPREIDRAIESTIPPTTRLLEVRVGEGIAFVDLSSDFQTAASSDVFILRFAQVVWTLTEMPEVSSVALAIDGQPVRPVTQTGIPVERPVSRADYDTVGPPGANVTEP